MDIRELVGRNVRRYRLAAGLSQEEVGARMGVDRAHVGLIERGAQNATLLTVWSLCEALGVRPQALFDEEYRDENPA
jgi:transcriptional regulator with XRE-family HTH domain